MKFLVQSEIALTVPPERLAGLLERTRNQVGRGDTRVSIDCVYGILGGRGAVAICEAPDAETMNAMLTDAPLFHFERFTIIPLVSFDAFLDGMIKAAVAASKPAAASEEA
jgi:hypothetical protein